MPTVQIATRIDETQSRLFRETTSRLGTTPADALRMFVAAFNEHHGFPYTVAFSKPKSMGTIDISSNYDVRPLPGTKRYPGPTVVKGKSWTL
jgi:antitoxin component of RelBE/YafQ-DinJ toxin-antitoxin module